MVVDDEVSSCNCEHRERKEVYRRSDRTEIKPRVRDLRQLQVRRRITRIVIRVRIVVSRAIGLACRRAAGAVDRHCVILILLRIDCLCAIDRHRADVCDIGARRIIRTPRERGRLIVDLLLVV